MISGAPLPPVGTVTKVSTDPSSTKTASVSVHAPLMSAAPEESCIHMAASAPADATLAGR